MKIWMFMTAFAVSGCASTATVLSDAPTETFRSVKSADEVAFCLANKNNAAPLIQPDGARVILIKNAYGAVGTAFSVYSEGSGSRVEYRRKIGIMIGSWKQCVGLKP